MDRGQAAPSDCRRNRPPVRAPAHRSRRCAPASGAATATGAVEAAGTPDCGPGPADPVGRKSARRWTRRRVGGRRRQRLIGGHDQIARHRNSGHVPVLADADRGRGSAPHSPPAARSIRTPGSEVAASTLPSQGGRPTASPIRRRPSDDLTSASTLLPECRPVQNIICSRRAVRVTFRPCNGRDTVP